MALTLEGSCHCGAVSFSVVSHTPYPFNYCYCSVCRKTAGGGGFAINVMGEAETLNVTGGAHKSIYHAVIDGQKSEAERHFCARCGSHLWLYDARWPNWIYPLASAIDSDLPAAPDRVHLMLDFRAGWAPVPAPGARDAHFPRYPTGSIETWHKERGLYDAG